MSRDSNSPTPQSPKLPPWLVMVLVLGFLGFAWYRNQQPHDATERERVLARQEKNEQSASSPAQAPSGKTTSKDESSDEPVVPQVMPEKLPSTTAAAPSKTTVPEKPRATTDRTPAPTRAGPSSTSPTQPTNDPRRDTPKTVSIEKPFTTTAQLENQTIRDFGRVVFKGTIDLQPTLDRIARGERNTHRNDGSTFGNRERQLPQKPQGYYTEYVHPTKGINGPGPQRVIFGKSGDIWYTSDHYETFKKIK